jgi:hypothetical protein
MPSSTIFEIVGDIIPPCGTPADVGNNVLSSMNPAVNLIFRYLGMVAKRARRWAE